MLPKCSSESSHGIVPILQIGKLRLNEISRVPGHLESHGQCGGGSALSSVYPRATALRPRLGILDPHSTAAS